MKIDLILLSVLLIVAALFRLARIEDFQYWSDDEQLLWFIVRHIVLDNHPSLVTPNVATGVGLGPLFHYLIAPWYALTNFQPEKLTILGSLFAFLSLIAIYYCGKLIGGRVVGFSASLMYAASFMQALFDRRLWALSPNVFLVTLSIIGLLKLVKGDWRYIYFLIPPFIFAFNSDPSLGMIVLATILTFTFFRPKLNQKYLIFAIIIFLTSLLPLLTFELRHEGQNTKSLVKFITQQKEKSEFQDIKEGNFLFLQFENFSRFIYVSPTKSADAYFCYCPLYDGQNSFFVVLLSLIITVFVFNSFRKKPANTIVLSIFLLSYFLGILTFKSIFKGNPAFFYSVTIAPVVFLIVAVMLAKNKVILTITLLVILALNFYTYANSGFRFPLRNRVALTKNLKSSLEDKGFSLYYNGDILVAGGGFTSIFFAHGLNPINGSLLDHWGHTYRSYNLYPITPDDQEPKTVVTITDKETGSTDKNQQTKRSKIIKTLSAGNLSAVIYDNSTFWFNSKTDAIYLYQPDYFSIK